MNLKCQLNLVYVHYAGECALQIHYKVLASPRLQLRNNFIRVFDPLNLPKQIHNSILAFNSRIIFHIQFS